MRDKAGFGVARDDDVAPDRPDDVLLAAHCSTIEVFHITGAVLADPPDP